MNAEEWLDNDDDAKDYCYCFNCGGMLDLFGECDNELCENSPNYEFRDFISGGDGGQ